MEKSEKMERKRKKKKKKRKNEKQKEKRLQRGTTRDGSKNVFVCFSSPKKRKKLSHSQKTVFEHPRRKLKIKVKKSEEK